MKKLIKKIGEKILISSLIASRRENGYIKLAQKLEEILPSLGNQTNYLKRDSKYLETKRRNTHTFQVDFTLNIIDKIEKEKISLIDIGDSSGNHLIQMQALSKKIEDIASVNLDSEAVEKIRNNGITAYHCRAEELLEKHNVNADIFVSYQMVEHLTDPVRFFKNISDANVCQKFVVSVPYQKSSRVGFWHIRQNNLKDKQNAESVHIFELSPDDWKLLVEFSGWRVVSDKIYYQYPKWSWQYFTKYVWKKIDFEGFYIMELEPDDTWSKLYESW